MLLAACASPTLAPVGRGPDLAAGEARTARKADVYVVKRGDTLYAIAFRHGLDYRVLGRWNGLSPPYTIYPGQKLRLSAPRAMAQAEVREKAESRAARAKPAVAPAPEPVEQANDADEAVTRWLWPAEGEVITSFKQSGGKGIDIAGTPGQPVRAAAGGRVVYSGGGLIGYGELIIIKHNKHYLSAYGHNEKLLVKQGDHVSGGQSIAEMGASGTDRVKLHFEIRRDGKPVDPIRYLPK